MIPYDWSQLLQTETSQKSLLKTLYYNNREVKDCQKLSNEKFNLSFNLTLRENRPYLELLWSIFSRIRVEYGEILNTEKSLRILSECGKIRARITPNTRFTQCNRTKYKKPSKFISWPKFLKGQHILSPEIWSKTFTDWFKKCSDWYYYIF